MPQRAVDRLPLLELWDETGPLPLEKKQGVGRQEISELLRLGRVQFVVANCGHPLEWVPLGDCYTFWKQEVKPRVVEPKAAGNGFRLDAYPGLYCYVAAEWTGGGPTPVVVLEMHH